jgi:hypothetical protein
LFAEEEAKLDLVSGLDAQLGVTFDFVCSFQLNDCWNKFVEGDREAIVFFLFWDHITAAATTEKVRL